MAAPRVRPVFLKDSDRVIWEESNEHRFNLALFGAFLFFMLPGGVVGIALYCWLN